MTGGGGRRIFFEREDGDHPRLCILVRTFHAVQLRILDRDASGSLVLDLTWRFWLGVSWIAGAAFFGARLGFSIRGFNRRLGSLTRISDTTVLGILGDCADRTGIRAPPVMSGPGIASPALFGIFRPRILLPLDLVDRMDPGILRAVFLHELSHLRRRDTAVNWLLAVLEVFHGMNPLVLWAFARLRAECEMACDEAALRSWGESDGEAYGSAMIRLLRSMSAERALPLAAGIGERRDSLQRRMEMIARFDPARKTSLALVAMTLGGCALLGLTGPTGDTSVLRSYDVMPLIDIRPDYPAPRLGLDSTAAPSAEPMPDLEAARRRNAEDLLARIKASIRPAVWGSGGTLSIEGNYLKVQAPPAVQEEIGSLLEVLERDRWTTVHIQVETLRILEADLEGLPSAISAKIEEPPSTGFPIRRPAIGDE